MQLKALAGAAALIVAVGVLCDRAIQGPPEMLIIWIFATLGVAIEGVIHLRILADDHQRVATAIVRPIPSSTPDCRR
jgi:hypothetical protein